MTAADTDGEHAAASAVLARWGISPSDVEVGHLAAAFAAAAGTGPMLDAVAVGDTPFDPAVEGHAPVKESAGGTGVAPASASDAGGAGQTGGDPGDPGGETVLGWAAALQCGAISSVELVTTLLARADELDGGIGSYLTRFDAAALAAAKVADDERVAGKARGPLHGLPIAVKDLIATTEAPTTAQSAVPPWYGGGWDAPVVERLRAAGLVILGKTTLNEFALGPPDPDSGFPLPRNPYDPQRWAGGSSSGSASGVAAGLFPGAIGSDTGGSIRIPAALCGVTGCKPTFGAVPTAGVVPMSWTADTLGPIAGTAADCAVLLEVLTGARPAAAASADPAGSLEGVHIGVDRAHQGVADVAPAVAEAFDRALDVLRRAGARLTEITVEDRAAIALAVITTTGVEAFAAHRHNLSRHWTDFGAGTRLWLTAGAAHDAATYLQAQRVRALARRRLAATFVGDGIDVIVSPTVGLVAPLFTTDFTTLMPLFFTSLWNATGFPAVSVPMGNDSAGLPVGLQIGARAHDEGSALRVAAAFQSLTDWHTRRPPTAPPKGDS